MPAKDAHALVPLATHRSICDRFFGVFLLVIV
jgi:hypothetical protein